MSHPTLWPRWGMIATLIILAAVSRLLPHPPNFTPIAAMALFGGLTLSNGRMAWGIPLGAMLLSDIALGLVMSGNPFAAFHSLMPVVYGCLLLYVLFGKQVRQAKHRYWALTGAILGAILGASLSFFVVTNFAVWLQGGYTYTWQGLVACYIAALPFFQNTLLGDIAYTTLLVGCLGLAEMQFPALREWVPSENK